MIAVSSYSSPEFMKFCTEYFFIFFFLAAFLISVQSKPQFIEGRQ